MDFFKQPGISFGGIHYSLAHSLTQLAMLCASTHLSQQTRPQASRIVLEQEAPEARVVPGPFLPLARGHFSLAWLRRVWRGAVTLISVGGTVMVAWMRCEHWIGEARGLAQRGCGVMSVGPVMGGACAVGRPRSRTLLVGLACH